MFFGATGASAAAVSKTTKNAWESDDSDSSDDERDSKLAISVAVGHIQKEKPASLKFDIAASGEGVGVTSADDKNLAAAPTPSGSSRPNTSQSSRPNSRGRPNSQTVNHSFVRLYAKQVLNDAFR